MCATSGHLSGMISEPSLEGGLRGPESGDSEKRTERKEKKTKDGFR